MPEPIVPTAPAPTADLSKIEETLSSLTDQLTSITDRLDSFEGKIETPPEPTPPTVEGWQPKTWEDFPKLVGEKATEIANSIYDERLRLSNEMADKVRKDQEASQKGIDAELDTIVTELTKSGKLPEVKNADDVNDPGRLAQKELYGLAVHYNSHDLRAIAELKDNLHQAGYSYDVMAKKVIRSSPAPYGKMAPVSSSQRATEGGRKPTYEDIHKSSMDSLVRRFMEGG